MILTWDEAKRKANLAKHGLDFADLTIDFFETSVVIPVREARMMVIGTFHRRTFIAVIIARLGAEAMSVISMRPASSKERKLLNDYKALG